MYSPKHFLEEELQKIRKLVNGNAFMTILSFTENNRQPFINHLHDKIELVETFHEQIEILKQLKNFFEAGEDQHGIIAGLLKRGDEAGLEIAAMMSN